MHYVFTSRFVFLLSVNIELESTDDNGNITKIPAKIVCVRNRSNRKDWLAMICTNTMHKVAEEIRAQLSIPLLHIAEATAQKLTDAGITRVGLLGTSYTMTESFYKDVIRKAGIEVLIPEGEDIQIVNSIIFNELCVGVIREESKQKLVDLIDRFRRSGAEGVILGCTELGLLIHPGDVDLPVFDTALIHAEEAALAALK